MFMQQMQVFRQSKTDKIARSTIKAMMRYGEMSKVLKNGMLRKEMYFCQGKKRGLLITKGFGLAQNKVAFSEELICLSRTEMV